MLFSPDYRQQNGLFWETPSGSAKYLNKNPMDWIVKAFSGFHPLHSKMHKTFELYEI